MPIDEAWLANPYAAPVDDVTRAQLDALDNVRQRLVLALCDLDGGNTIAVTVVCGVIDDYAVGLIEDAHNITD